MQRWSVLVVEDDQDARSLYAYMLASAGYRVRAAKNGLEALTEIQLERPDVVLTDIAMPILDGLELIRAMKASEEMSALPIVAMTSYGDDFKHYARQAGANETVDKSIEEKGLQALIGSLVAGQPMQNPVSPSAA